jgi:hypothetical protein
MFQLLSFDESKWLGALAVNLNVEQEECEQNYEFEQKDFLREIGMLGIHAAKVGRWEAARVYGAAVRSCTSMAPRSR